MERTMPENTVTIEEFAQKIFDCVNDMHIAKYGGPITNELQARVSARSQCNRYEVYNEAEVKLAAEVVFSAEFPED